MNVDDIRGRATISVEQTAQLLGVGRSACYEAIRRGELPALRLGRRIRVPVGRLLKILEGSQSPEGGGEGE